MGGGAASSIQSNCTVDATGRCTSGILNVSVDLTQAPPGVGSAGQYNVTVVNPGYPSSLASSPLTFTIAASCP